MTLERGNLSQWLCSSVWLLYRTTYFSGMVLTILNFLKCQRQRLTGRLYGVSYLSAAFGIGSIAAQNGLDDNALIQPGGWQGWKQELFFVLGVNDACGEQLIKCR